MNQKLILIGGGGHCRSCIDVIEEEGKYRICGIVDVPEKRNKNAIGYDVVASDHELDELVKEYSNFSITIGQIGKPEKRMFLYNQLKQYGAKLPIVVSPRAYVSKHAKVGEGSFVMHNAVVNAAAIIGKNCIINTGALIEHDVIVEDHCHISPGVVLNGGVKIRKESFIGSNTVLRERVEIGAQSVVSCGLRIMHSIPDNSLVRK
jgi:sugar O-acyltransferase (sialic acid O-acetyltransferase NeuD family)